MRIVTRPIHPAHSPAADLVPGQHPGPSLPFPYAHVHRVQRDLAFGVTAICNAISFLTETWTVARPHYRDRPYFCAGIADLPPSPSVTGTNETYQDRPCHRNSVQDHWHSARSLFFRHLCSSLGNTRSDALAIPNRHFGSDRKRTTVPNQLNIGEVEHQILVDAGATRRGVCQHTSTCTVDGIVANDVVVCSAFCAEHRSACADICCSGSLIAHVPA